MTTLTPIGMTPEGLLAIPKPADGFTVIPTSISIPTTVSGGNAVVYPTNTGLVGGAALFKSILSVQAVFDANDPNYARGKAVIAGDLKTVTVPCSRQTFTGVVVLGISVLGSNTVGVPVNGTALTITITGVLA